MMNKKMLFMFVFGLTTACSADFKEGITKVEDTTKSVEETKTVGNFSLELEITDSETLMKEIKAGDFTRIKEAVTYIKSYLADTRAMEEVVEQLSVEFCKDIKGLEGLSEDDIEELVKAVKSVIEETKKEEVKLAEDSKDKV